MCCWPRQPRAWSRATCGNASGSSWDRSRCWSAARSSGSPSSRLGSAAASLEDGGRLLVSTSAQHGHIEIALTAEGRGRTATEWAAALDPDFSFSGDRVSTGDWDLLAGRQVIQDHRGRIRIDDAAGRAAAIRIALPCDSE